MASLDEAFKVNMNHTYIKPEYYYDDKCIYCGNRKTLPLLNDGGSIRQCETCKRTFRAKKVYYE